MSFIISTDDACDVSYAQLDAFDIKYKKGLYRLDGFPLREAPSTESEHDALCDKLVSGALLSVDPQTSARYEGYFDELFENGAEKVLHICVGSSFSDNYACAERALKNEALKFPRTELYVLDARTLSAGLTLLLERAVLLRDAGIDAGEAFVRLNELTQTTETLLAPHDLDSLIRSKLVSSTADIGKKLVPLSLLAVKNGRLTLVSRFKGYASLSQKLADEAHGAKQLFVSHSGSTAAARELGAVVPVEITRTGLFSTSLVGVNATIIAFEKSLP